MGRKRKNPEPELPALKRGIVWRNNAFHYRYYAPDIPGGKSRQHSEKLCRGAKDDPAAIEEANNLLRAKRDAELKNAGKRPPSDYTVSDIWGLFIAQGGKRGRPFRPSTRKSYESTWDIYLRDYFDGKRIADIDDNTLAAYRLYLEELGKKRSAENAHKERDYEAARLKAKPGKEPQPPTLYDGERSRELAFLLVKSMLSFAHRRGYIEKNPGVLFQTKPSNKRPHVMLDRTQTEALIQATDPHYAPMVEAALYLGLRGQELVCLRWSDIEFRENSHNPDAFAAVEVSRAVSRGIEGPTKTTAAMRTVPIPTRLKRTLLRVRDEQRAAGTYDRRGLVFTTKGRPYEGGSVVGAGKMIRLDNFRKRVFNPALKAAGLEDSGMTFHGLRAQWISWLVEGNPAKNVNPTPAALIMLCAGHADFSTTERYLARRDKQLEHIMAIFEDD